MQHTHSRIYRTSLQLIELARRVLGELPPGYGFLGDPLRRAAASVTLDFAEGCGKRSVRGRRRFFDIARGSVYEVAAVLDVADGFGVLHRGLHGEGQELCDHLGAMLTRFR